MPVVSNARLGGLVAFYMLTAALLYGATGLSVGIAGAGGKLAIMSLAAMAFFSPWVRGRPLERFVDLTACWGLMTILSTAGALISYPLVLGTQGWTDPWLAAMDSAIGFDWAGAYWLVARQPNLASVLALGYLSIFFTPALVIAGLAILGKGGAARAFLFAFGVALAIKLLVYRFFPARAALAHYVGTDVPFMPVNGIAHIAAIDQLRSGALTTIQVNQIVGMITFPSFHAVSAVLFIWAGWGVPGLRVPITALNIIMLVATPVQGTHYLVDVIAGVAIALFSIGILYLPSGLVLPRIGRLVTVGRRLAPT